MTDETITETTTVSTDNGTGTNTTTPVNTTAPEAAAVDTHANSGAGPSQPLLGTSVTAYMASFPVDYPGPVVTTTTATFDPPLTEEGMRRVLREELAKLLADRAAQNSDECKAAREAREASAEAAERTAKRLARKARKAARTAKTKKAKMGKAKKAKKVGLRPWRLGER